MGKLYPEENAFINFDGSVSYILCAVMLWAMDTVALAATMGGVYTCSGGKTTGSEAFAGVQCGGGTKYTTTNSGQLKSTTATVLHDGTDVIFCIVFGTIENERYTIWFRENIRHQFTQNMENEGNGRYGIETGGVLYYCRLPEIFFGVKKYESYI